MRIATVTRKYVDTASETVVGVPVRDRGGLVAVSVRWWSVTGAIDVAHAFQSQGMKRLYMDLGQSCSSRRC